MIEHNKLAFDQRDYRLVKKEYLTTIIDNFSLADSSLP